MTPTFKVIEHVLPGQHIREYPNATKGRQEDALKLSIKQYIPVNGPDPAPENSITIIGAHGLGFPKETYEPFWEDLYHSLQSSGIHIRGIWMADASNQGASGVLNETVQGDSSSWFDHSRDLLHMINHFRDLMPRPLIGIAHSMGCAQLVQMSIMHPRLLSSLLLIEPVILDEFAPGPDPAMRSTFRRDIWDSRSQAESSVRKMFGSWDRRALDKFLQYGLRQTPTLVHNPAVDHSLPPQAVTLTTSKHQEAWTYTQINFEPEERKLDPLLQPDWDPKVSLPLRSARPECLIALRNLPFLRPSVFYVFGGQCPFSQPYHQDQKIQTTGTGLGGNGGGAKVEKKVFPEYGHMLVLEHPEEVAHPASHWIQKWYQTYIEEERALLEYGSKKSDPEMIRTSQDWMEAVKLPVGSLRPKSAKL